jgi:nucleoside-diphosphate-sugar epimerase
MADANDNKKVVIAGASGIIGQAAVRQFLDSGWEVVGVSRRPPDALGHARLEHLAVDLRDAEACAAAFADLGATHLVYAALYEKPGLVAGWEEGDQMQTNLGMFENLLEPLSRDGALVHATVFQGTKAYGSHLHDIPIPAKESQPRDPHPNFYWLQEDHLREVAPERGFAFTILRPQMVSGGAVGVAMNVLPAVGAYAAICAKLGEPCGFPGGPAFVWECSDVRLVARACEWAARSPVAAGETYNVTNGDVFSWRDLWPGWMETLGVEAGPDKPVALAEFLIANEAAWDEIVAENDLQPPDLGEMLGESAHMADYCFAYGQTGQPRAKFISTIKIRQAGFADCMDTDEAFRYWLQDMVDRKVFPDKTALAAFAAAD